MNETLRTLMERRSIRSFEQRQVGHGDLDLVIRAGLQAATAMNRQSWHVTVVQDPAVLEALSKAVAKVMAGSQVPSLVERASDPTFSCFHHAPTVVFLSSDGTSYSLADCANAAQNMCVAAWSLGVGSCYIGSFAQGLGISEGRAAIDRFSLPEGYHPVYAIALGYPRGPLPAVKTREFKVSYIL